MPDTIGMPAIDRPGSFSFTYTIVEMENPAQMTGFVTQVEIYSAIAGTGIEVAVFEEVAPFTFTTRSDQFIGDVPLGYSSHVVSLPVAIGDFIGIHGLSGSIEKSNTGVGCRYEVADYIPCVDQYIPGRNARTISLLGHITVPTPPLLNWALVDLHYCQTPFQIKVTSYTDLPCHLWLRWSTHQPRRHPAPVTTRGITLMTDIRFCFTVFEDLEQEEGMDTLVHTFYLPVWPVCTTFWYYFYGTVVTVTSPSTSAIFKSHRSEPFRWLMAEQWSS